MRDELSLEFVSLLNEPARKIPECRAIGAEYAQKERQRSHVQIQRGQRQQEQIRRRRIRNKRIKKTIIRMCLIAVTIGMAVWFAGVLWDNMGLKEVVSSFFEGVVEGAKGNGIPHPEWTEDFLTVNPYSRPGDTLPEVKDIFVQYTANPGTNAVQNRSYFEQLKDTHERAASAHFII